MKVKKPQPPATTPAEPTPSTSEPTGSRFCYDSLTDGPIKFVFLPKKKAAKKQRQ